MDPLRAIGDAARLGHRDEELKIDQIETHGISAKPSLRAEGSDARSRSGWSRAETAFANRRLSP